MIKAVIFDMFETLVTLFEGRTYFSENIVQDLGLPLNTFRKAWHSNEKERTIGKYSMKEGVVLTLKTVGAWSEENVELVIRKRREALEDTFSAIPQASIELLKTLHQKRFKVGLITNTFSDECLYVGDGGSRELFGAREAGMQALQCTWFSDRAFEPHIPCPPLDEFPHAQTQMDVIKFIEEKKK